MLRECASSHVPQANDTAWTAALRQKGIDVFDESMAVADGKLYGMASLGGAKRLMVAGGNEAGFEEDAAIQLDGEAVFCYLNNENCKKLSEILTFMKPVAPKSRPVTIGMGDRTGIATPGHILALRQTDAFPVLAQQSMRELLFTGRSYEDVVCNAAWGVFQRGYRLGYGADGDHLKTPGEVEAAIGAGATMITWDCSATIDASVSEWPESEVDARYVSLPLDYRERLELTYLGGSNPLGIPFDGRSLKKSALTYHEAIQDIRRVYRQHIEKNGLYFEISVDEGKNPTTVQEHYFLAREMMELHVKLHSLAPKFPGEFQKGIDYIGDVRLFEKELTTHKQIADSFGYKLSIHSGSDKYTVFPVIARVLEGKYHLKTAGTSWLEVCRLAAQEEAELFREMWRCAVGNLEANKRFYRVDVTEKNLPDISKISDLELQGLLEDNTARQLLHISYGPMLNAAESGKQGSLANRVYHMLQCREEHYDTLLAAHFGNHFEFLALRGQ